MDRGLPTLTELIVIGRAFYRAISDYQPRCWGEIVRDDENPHSYDSNHAYVGSPVTPEQYVAILAEVEAFYRSAPGGARVRYYTAIVPPSFLKLAAQTGWQTRLEESTWRAWLASSAPLRASELPGLTIQLPTTADWESCHLVLEEDAPQDSRERLRRTWDRLTCTPNVTPLIARLDGYPAAVMAIFGHDRWGCIEEATTRQCFRRRGICTALLRFAQDLAIRREYDGLMLYDIEEGPDRVYARAGFQLIAKTQCAMAWRQ
jgi:hypothetical protein